MREEQQFDIVVVVDSWAFVGRDSGDGGVRVNVESEVDVFWQWGDVVASIGVAMDKHGEEVNLGTRGFQGSANVARPDDFKCAVQAVLAVHFAGQ